MTPDFSNLTHQKITDLISSTDSPVPAAISTAALNSINGLALAELAIKVTLNNKTDQDLNKFLKQVPQYKKELYQLAAKDCQSWDQENKTFKKELLINIPSQLAEKLIAILEELNQIKAKITGQITADLQAGYAIIKNSTQIAIDIYRLNLDYFDLPLTKFNDIKDKIPNGEKYNYNI